MGFVGIGLNTIGISLFIIDSLKFVKNGKESFFWLCFLFDGGVII